LAVYAGPAAADAGFHWLRATLQTQAAGKASKAGNAGNARQISGRAGAKPLCATLWIGADSAALQAMGLRCHGLPVIRRALRDVLGVRARLRCEVGRQIFPLSELRSLRPGDTVFIDEHVDHAGAHELRLYISNRCVLHAEVGPSNALTITGMGMNHDENLAGGMAFVHAPGDAADPDARDEPLGANGPDGPNDRDGLDERDIPDNPNGPNDLDHPDEAADIGALADIPVMVTFDVGQCELTIGELRELVTGSIIELGGPLTEVVNLRAGGKLIGLGELIEIDGRIGVLVAKVGEAR
jgi:type III secretion system YscQ/HrcQ family protein